MTHATEVSTKWQKLFGSPMHEFKTATRVQGSLLASSEKKALTWLAAHTPGAINSDHLTVLGLLAMALANLGLSARSVTVPFDLRNGALTIEAEIDGQGPFRFIFDTGGHAIVSPALSLIPI